MARTPLAKFFSAVLLFMMVNLKAAPTAVFGCHHVSAELGAQMDSA
jgi:hypothetical protein